MEDTSSGFRNTSFLFYQCEAASPGCIHFESVGGFLAKSCCIVGVEYPVFFLNTSAVLCTLKTPTSTHFFFFLQTETILLTTFEKCFAWPHLHKWYDPLPRRSPSLYPMLPNRFDAIPTGYTLVFKPGKDASSRD